MSPKFTAKLVGKLGNKKFNKTKKKRLKSGTRPLKSGVITIDRKGDVNVKEQQNDTSGKSRKAKKREAKAYKQMVEREKELALDLFGIDDDDISTDPTPATVPTSPSAPPKKKVKEIKVKKGKKKKKGKQMIPDDPFDIHGTAEKEERQPAWVDDDDIQVKVKDVAATKRNAKGSTGVQENSEQQYSETLRKQFTQVVGGTPEWASLDREDDDDREEDGMLTMGTGDYLSRTKGGALKKSRLYFKKVCNLNHQSQTEGPIIKVVEFNPHLPVALVGGRCGLNGSATLFKVDGITNHKIQSVRFPNYPIRCGKFLADGKKFLVSSTKEHNFFCYNMESGQLLRFPANIRNNMFGIKSFAVSPGGNFVVTLAPSGIMDVFDGRVLSHIHTFYAPEEVYCITFNENGTRMYSHGAGGDVCVWDMDTRQCVHRFYDDGCIKGTSIAASGCYLACGSSSGVVNIYDTSQLVSNPTPTPVKVLSKLLTPVTSLAFNSSTEILATASREREEAFKLVHFPSMTYFENFPANHTFRIVQTLNFSPLSGLLAAGNDHGNAQLFRLHHYKSY